MLVLLVFSFKIAKCTNKKGIKLLSIQVIKSEQNSALFQEALLIRHTVFVEEQGFDSTLEVDQYDSIAFHFVAYWNHKPVGVLRTFSKEEGILKVGRVAVLASFRGQKVGSKLMQYLVEWVKNKANNLTCQKIELSSQIQVIPFYEQLNYKKEGNLFFEENILHQKMIQLL